MPGCLSYIVAKDPTDADAIWITEVWDSRESHAPRCSCRRSRPRSRGARAVVAGFDNGHETEPFGGIGLPARRGRELTSS